MEIAAVMLLRVRTSTVQVVAEPVPLVLTAQPQVCLQLLVESDDNPTSPASTPTTQLVEVALVGGRMSGLPVALVEVEMAAA